MLGGKDASPGAVCSIFTQASREQSAFFESMDTLNKFLKDKLLHISDPELCGNLRRFYRFAFNSASASNSFDNILGHLSPSLKGALAFKVRPLVASSRCPRPQPLSVLMMAGGALHSPDGWRRLTAIGRLVLIFGTL